MKYRQHRHLTHYPVNVRTARGLQNCHVLDVTHAGARLLGLTGAQRGDKIQIDILSQNVAAVVLWVKAETAGVGFRPQLPERQLETLRRQQRQYQAKPRGRVGFHFAEMH